MIKIRNPLSHEQFVDTSNSAKLNWLRAAVLGANDGIISVSSVILGVAGATSNKAFVLTAGLAALVAGALSMATGEYVSVSTQRDTERVFIEKERKELQENPEREMMELAVIYEKKGLSKATAEVVARELSLKDPLMAHLDAELNIDPNDLTDPLHAAYASGLAFVTGGAIPVLAILLSTQSLHIVVTYVSVIIALVITGVLSAKAGEADKVRATARVLFGGIFAMTVTYVVGKIFGVAI